MSGDLYCQKYAPAIDIDDSGSYRRSTHVWWNGKAMRFKQRLDTPVSTLGSLMGVAVNITSLSSKSELHFDEPRVDIFGQTVTATRNVFESLIPKFTAVDSTLNAVLSARPALLGENWELHQRNSAYEIDVHGLNGLRSTRRINTATATATAVTNNGYEGNLANGTYYYRVWTTDAELRKTVAAAETSCTTSAPTPLASLTGNLQGSPLVVTILRGTSAGVYTHWVSIPIAKANYELFDQGDSIGGYAWSAVSVPSVSVDAQTEDGYIVRNNGRAIIFKGSAPTVGAWAVGDTCWNTSATSSTTPGWVCTTAGSPGTWTAMPQLGIVGFTNELVDDRVAALLVAGTNITLTYDDTANTLTIAASGGSSYTDEQAMDAIAAMLTQGTGITLTYNDVANTLTVATSITQYTDEMARDAIGTALVQGTGITITVNDAGDTITIANTVTQYTDEQVRDIIGTALAGTGLITVTVNDALDTITISTTATANDTDANLKNRANHTGTQLASTVSDFSEAVDDRVGALVADTTRIDVTYNDAGNALTLDTTSAGGYIIYTQSAPAASWVLGPGQQADATRPRMFIGPDAPESTFPSYVARTGDTHLDTT